MKKPFKHFDLPTKHLSERHYVPPKARTADEIDRRRSLPRGTVLLEQQQHGLAMAGTMLERVEEPQDVDFATRVLAMCAVNTGWYSFARGAQVMRRRLLLPELAGEDGDWRENRQGLLVRLEHDLADTALLATYVLRAKIDKLDVAFRTKLFGRRVGNLSLALACVPKADAAKFLTAFDAQALARNEALAIIEGARVLGEEIGVNPSIAQLPDPDSPLSVYWRRRAPNGAYDAYEEAIAA